MEIEFIKAAGSQGCRDPTRMTNDSIGYDLFSPLEFQILPGQQKTIDTGIIFLMGNPIDDNNNVYYGHISDKSSVASRKKCQVLGKVIDPGYRGTVQVILRNNSDRDTASFAKNDPIAQIVFIRAFLPRLVRKMGNVAATERGARGFGEVTEEFLKK